MTDEPIKQIAERIAAIEAGLYGPAGKPLSGASIEERLRVVEQALSAMMVESAAAMTAAGGDSRTELLELPAVEVEFGLVKTAPSANSDVSTITLSPCDYTGTKFDDADDVVVHLRSDATSESIDIRGWTTYTVVRWQRYPVPISSVDGVILGESHQDQDSTVATSGSYQSTQCFDTQFRFDKYGHCIGWYWFDSSNWQWESPWSYPNPSTPPA